MLAGRHSIGAGGAGGGVFEFVGSRTFTEGSTSTFTIPLTTLTGGIASAPRTGDLVVAFIGQASGGNDDVPMPSEWDELARVQGVSGNSSDLYVIYKTMGATPDTGFDIVGGLASVQSGLSVAIFVYEGASTAAPVFTTANGDDTVLCDPPAITPTVAGSIVLSGGVGAHTEGIETFSSSAFDDFLTVGVDEGFRDATIGVGRFAWTSGAFNPAEFTFSASDFRRFSWAALSLVIIPE